ncbi:MAG: hypothetical protein CHACPFDD_03104 [Phycisphaerae bacterium]|nr:hypothetical protein [Phycisphaerae bacterium]
MTLKLTEVARIAADYCAHLPGWAPLGKDALRRVAYPVMQGICFDRASDDVYRPLSFIDVLVGYPKGTPGLGLAKYLRHKRGAPQWSVRLRDHERDFNEVLDAMVRQFRPRVLVPLDPLEVVSIYENEEYHNTPKAYELASLHAYYDHLREARTWCRRFWEIDAQRPYPDALRRALVTQLETWIETGTAREQVDAIGRENAWRLSITV